MIDTRRYQMMIGGLGLLLVVAFSIYLYANGGRGDHPGVAAGQPLKHFVAPLATSDLNVPANVSPRCDPTRPARRGLNVCGRRPIVLAFFAVGAKPCIRAVSSLQAIAPRFPQATFAAVAAGGNKPATLKLVHQHHWTIPVGLRLDRSRRAALRRDGVSDDRGRPRRRHRQQAADRRALGTGHSAHCCARPRAI